MGLLTSIFVAACCAYIGLSLGGKLGKWTANIGVPSATRKRIDAVDALQDLGMSYGEARDTVYEFQRRIGAE